MVGLLIGEKLKVRVMNWWLNKKVEYIKFFSETFILMSDDIVGMSIAIYIRQAGK